MTDKLIIQLQERLAFQEHELDKLNRVVAEQQLELDALGREVKDLRVKVRTEGSGDPGDERSLEDDRPPHY